MRNHKKSARQQRRQAGRFHSEKLEERQMLAADLIETIDLSTITDDDVLSEVASIDGVGNNLDNPDWGAAGTALIRLGTVEYADGLSEPAGADRPSAREISNEVADQAELISNDRYLTDFVWLWGQFIDHDLDLSVEADPAEELEIEVPAGDVDFDPFGTGAVTITLDRSDYEVDDDGVRQQVNSITAYLDGSVVYGSDAETAASLREGEGGRMATSAGDLLPIGEDGFFMAGDVRANENVALTSMHTLWVREHNRLAEEIMAADPSLDPVADDEAIFQQARALVVAQIQAITYNEWLPALLGVDAIASYSGYDPTVNASIANVFSTAAYRFGHSMLSTDLLRLNNDGTEAVEGNLSLAEAFFSPDEVMDHGIDSLLVGAANQVAQEIDNMIVDDVRNFLFGPPGAGGLDLASLNIERGRDHGLPDYNQLREDYGLARVTGFDEITSDSDLADKLALLYGSVDDIDPWVGILAEDHVAGSSLGELGGTILIDQFTRIRDGDRFWYENLYQGQTLRTLQNTSLSEVIERNTDITGLQDNVFYDKSVLYYAAESGTRRGANVVVTTKGDDLVVRQAGTRRVLASVPVDEATKIVLIGSQTRSDRFIIGADVASLNLPGGVVIDGQEGGRDRLFLRGSRQRDTFAVDGAFLTMGETEMQAEDIEVLNIRTGRGPDDVEIVDDSAMRVVVDGRGPFFRRLVERFRPARRQAPPTLALAGPEVRGRMVVDQQRAEVDLAMEELGGILGPRQQSQSSQQQASQQQPGPIDNRVGPPQLGRDVSALLGTGRLRRS